MTAATLTRQAHRSGRRSDVILLGVGAAVLVASALPVDADRVSRVERLVFRLFNDRPVLPFALVWPVMQLGNIAAVPAAAAAAALRRRRMLAAELLAGGTAAYLLAKAVKYVVERGRPADLLADVQLRGTPAGGLGYVSGHAAVAAVLTGLAWPHLHRRGRTVAVILAAVVGSARMFVGAHLPLDIVGGAAVGLIVAAAVRLLFGRRTEC